jgi:hypothetical protein
MNPSIKGAYNQLPQEQQAAYERDFRKRRKVVSTAYIAWFFLGWHYLYMGRVGMQFAFWFTGCFFVIGWFVDFFRVFGMVQRYNEDLSRELMVQHKALSAGI